MQQSGEFLSSPSPKLSQSPLTVALIYNLKAEAPLQSSLATSQVHTPSSDASHLALDGRSLITHVPGSSDRANDLYIEWDSPDTVDAVRAALEERYSVTMIEANEEAYQKLVKNRPDFAFNMSEGLYGASREAQIPAILEMLQIPYVGSDPLTLSVCLDKARAKEILSYYGIPTAPFAVIRSMVEISKRNGSSENVRVKFPAIVKPLHEGSSKGIYNSCVVKNTGELEREVQIVLSTYNQPALVEEFLSGREFTVAMLGNGDAIRTLPIVEIKFDALPPGVNPIYSYEAKWIWDQSEQPLEIFECPAELDETLRRDIETICRDAFKVLNCRDWSRIDVRLDAAGTPHILEINPLPGILPRPEDNSCFPKAARAVGMSYNQLINSVLDIAMERCGLRVFRQMNVIDAGVVV